MTTATATEPNEAQVLAKAVLNACRVLGIRQAELGRIIGRDCSTLIRSGVDPTTHSGQLALMLVRCYRSLYALMGGNPEQIRHWMRTHNHHTGGIPAEQCRSIEGLVRICDYLDAIRGKV